MRTEYSQERELRRVLKKAGYALHKSPRVVFPDNFGGYMIISLDSNSVAAGSRYELSLEDVQEWVNEMC
mgnify:FL=1